MNGNQIARVIREAAADVSDPYDDDYGQADARIAEAFNRLATAFEEAHKSGVGVARRLFDQSCDDESAVHDG